MFGVSCESLVMEVWCYRIEGGNVLINLHVKKVVVSLVLLATLTLLLIHTQNAHAVEWTTLEKTSRFLENVIGLDMTRYEVSGGTDIATGFVTYNLKSGESIVEVLTRFRNGVLVYCNVNPLDGLTPFYSQQPSVNLLDAAEELIQRYHDYSNAPYLQVMRDMLDTMTEVKPENLTWSDVTFRISLDDDFTYVEWIQTVNGIEIRRNRLQLSFLDGAFYSFQDDWDLYSIGTTELKVSREEAIRIAREQAENYSWRLAGADNTRVTDFTILDSPVSAEWSMQIRDSNTLYPWWDVRLYLDKVYEGNVYAIQVTLWGDTGEVTHVQAISHMGAPPNQEPTTPTNEPPSDTQQETDFAGNVPAIAVTASIAATVALAAVVEVIKKRRKSN